MTHLDLAPVFLGGVWEGEQVKRGQLVGADVHSARHTGLAGDEADNFIAPTGHVPLEVSVHPETSLSTHQLATFDHNYSTVVFALETGPDEDGSGHGFGFDLAGTGHLVSGNLVGNVGLFVDVVGDVVTRQDNFEVGGHGRWWAGVGSGHRVVRRANHMSQRLRAEFVWRDRETALAVRLQSRESCAVSHWSHSQRLCCVE